MTDKEILTAVMKKAVKRGYVRPEKFPTKEPFFIWIDTHYIPGQYMSRESIFFSHDFAKAFWGEELTKELVGKTPHPESENGEALVFEFKKKWKVHLQILVLEEDKLKYLSKFL